MQCLNKQALQKLGMCETRASKREAIIKLGKKKHIQKGSVSDEIPYFLTQVK